MNDYSEFFSKLARWQDEYVFKATYYKDDNIFSSEDYNIEFDEEDENSIRLVSNQYEDKEVHLSSEDITEAEIIDSSFSLALKNGFCLDIRILKIIDPEKLYIL